MAVLNALIHAPVHGLNVVGVRLLNIALGFLDLAWVSNARVPIVVSWRGIGCD